MPVRFGEFVGCGRHHPVKRSLTPLRRRGIARTVWGICWVRKTPPRQAELDTPPTGGELPVRFGEFVGCGRHHPVKRSLTPLRRRGIARTVWGICWVRKTPPCQAELDTPPKEGNCPYGLGSLLGAEDTILSGFAAGYRRDAIAVVCLY